MRTKLKKVISLYLAFVMISSILTIAPISVSSAGIDFSSYANNQNSLYNNYLETMMKFSNNISINDESNNGLFSSIIYDFDNDGKEELVTAEIWHRGDEPYIVFCLYKTENNDVKLADTLSRMDIVGYGNYSVYICATLFNNSIMLQKSVYSNGGSIRVQEYYKILIANNKISLKSDYSLIEYPRYDRYEYSEIISGKTYSSYNEFKLALQKANQNICNHNDFDYENDDYSKYEGFKGNHIFTIYHDVNFNSSGDTGFIYSNNSIQYTNISNIPQSLSFNECFSNDIIDNYSYINSTEGPAEPLMDDAWDINKLANGFVQSISHFHNGKTTEENIQEFYDAVLYDLIANTYSLPNFDSYMQKRFNRLQNEMINYFIGKGFKLANPVNKKDAETLLECFTDFVNDFVGINKNDYQLTYELVNSVADGFRDGTECVEKLSQYMVLKEEGAKLNGALELMAKNAENNILKKAINDIINSLTMTPQQYMDYVVTDKMKEYGLSTVEKVATKIFEEIIVKGFKKVFEKELPIDEIKLIADITNCLTETFFATTTNSDQQYRLYIYIQIENSCKKSITSAKNTYLNNKSVDNAEALVSCYDMYLRIYEHEIAECLNLAEIYYNQGIFNNVKNMMFNNGKNYQAVVDWINSYNYDLSKLQELEQASYEKWGLEKGLIKKVYVFALVNDKVAFYNDFIVDTGSTFNIPSMQGVIDTLKKTTGYDVVTNGNYHDRQLKNRIIGGSIKVNNNTAVFVDMDLVKRQLTKATTSKDGSLITIDALTNKQLYNTAIPKISNIKLNGTSYTYSGKMITPKVTIKNSKNYSLKEGTDYKLSYSSGRKNVGKYSVKITFKGNYSGSKTLYFTIKPKETTVSSLIAKSKGFTVKWKKMTVQTTGYEIQYATNNRFTINENTIDVCKNISRSKTISKLLAKKKYYVRIRVYKRVIVKGKTTKIYSNWSKSKTVTTKK